MEKLFPTKMDIKSINGGNKYTNADGLQAETINAVVESAAWGQALAENTPDTSNADKVGTPSVTIGIKIDGTPQFVFANLKGADGRNGADGKNGIDGKTPKLQVNDDGALQVRYNDGETWDTIYTFPWYEGATS